MSWWFGRRRFFLFVCQMIVLGFLATFCEACKLTFNFKEPRGGDFQPGEVSKELFRCIELFPTAPNRRQEQSRFHIPGALPEDFSHEGFRPGKISLKIGVHCVGKCILRRPTLFSPGRSPHKLI